jgi:hypothetical protein
LDWSRFRVPGFLNRFVDVVSQIKRAKWHRAEWIREA